MGAHAVNFYKHHLGDYDGATAHLSWDEDQAYTRLLRVYYRLERPIPKDPSTTYRLVRAQTRGQKDAVTRVLHEFFEERPTGWHNKRADEEIAAYQAQASTNRRIARTRSTASSTDDPPTNRGTNRERTDNDSSTKGAPNHKPLAMNHEPSTTRDGSDVRDLSKAVGGERSDSTPAPASGAIDQPRPVRELVQATAARLTRKFG